MTENSVQQIKTREERHRKTKHHEKSNEQTNERRPYSTTFHLLAFWLSTSTTFIVENCSPHQIINPIKDKSTPQIYKYKCLLPLSPPLRLRSHEYTSLSVCVARAPQIKKKNIESRNHIQKDTSHLYVLFGIWRQRRTRSHKK